jgi:hypothetical protein
MTRCLILGSGSERPWNILRTYEAPHEGNAPAQSSLVMVTVAMLGRPKT